MTLLRIIFLIFLCVGTFFSNSSLAQSKEAFIKRRPNVIIIYTDDQGSLDLNIYGANDLYTPNLDQLAKNGVRFTQFYTASPVC